MAAHLLSLKRCGLLFNPGALWIGMHFSAHNGRLCVNLLPMLTVWFIKVGGIRP